MEELLSLKWNNHRTTFLHILTVLRDKQLYTDATLACDGKLYSVHKLVLSTCSDYFSSMLDRTSCKNPVIVLKDIKCEDLEALLDYMYLGEVNVRQSDLATLIKAAECLRVKGLAVPDDDPRPTPRKTRVNETQSRRRDTSISPPAKRKRRSDVDDGRDDVRPVRQEPRQSSPVHSSSHVRPKSPLNNSNTSSSISNKIVPTVNSSSVNSNLDTKIDNSVDNENIVPSVKVEVVEDDLDGIDDRPDGVVDTGGGDSSVGVDLTDNYNLNNEDFKEEDDDTDGADLGTDLPEFLQQATANYPHSSFPGTSFQPDLSWQGGDGGSGNSGGMAGSFAAAAAAGLSFGSSVQDGQNTSSGASSYTIATKSNSHSYLQSHSIVPATIPNYPTSSARSLTGLTSVNLHRKKNIQENYARLYAPSNDLEEKFHNSNSMQRSLAVYSQSGADDNESCSCNVCDKVFLGVYRKYNLRKHMVLHTGMKPYVCPYCQSAFNQKGNLKRHMSSIHANEITAIVPSINDAFFSGSVEESDDNQQNISGPNSETPDTALRQTLEYRAQEGALDISPL